jgi:mono/diheme cytochrome c family protein
MSRSGKLLFVGLAFLRAAAASADDSPARCLIGAELYQARCQQCHGRNLKANGPGMFDLREYGGDLETFAAAIESGVVNMPPQIGVTDEEIAALFNYAAGRCGASE